MISWNFSVFGTDFYDFLFHLLFAGLINCETRGQGRKREGGNERERRKDRESREMERGREYVGGEVVESDAGRGDRRGWKEGERCRQGEGCQEKKGQRRMEDREKHI